MAGKAEKKDRDEAQLERFRKAAKSLGAEDNPQAFDRAFKKIVKPAQKRRSSAMAAQHFRLWKPDEVDGEEYWVLAESSDGARKALTDTPKLGIRDASKFACAPDTHKQPPEGFIHRRLNGPVAIGEK